MVALDKVPQPKDDLVLQWGGLHGEDQTFGGKLCTWQQHVGSTWESL